MFLEDIRARGFAPRGIIDVGANRGGWARMARAIFPNASILMIEPQEEMSEALTQFTRSDRLVDFVQAGAGEKAGELVQTIWSDLAGSSFLPAVTEHGLAQGTQRRTRIVAIDDLMRVRPKFEPDLVKLDIQGFELEAIKGAECLFGRTELFIMETSLFQFMNRMPTTHDCITFMSDRGYDLYDVTEYLRRPLDGALGQIDLAFARRDGALRSSHDWGV